MRTKFLAALSEPLQVEPAELTDSFELSWDSLLIVATMSLISEYYDCTVEIDALLQCSTIGQLLSLINSSGEQRAAA